MSNIVGIDVGGSTTKIVGLKDGEIYSPMLVRAGDPLSSIYGAFGKFLNVNKLSIPNVDKIMVTGVGASYLTDKIYGIPTVKVDEFNSIGKGGLFISKLNRAIIVSMGTGTTYVMADESGVTHMGGTGVGGGTLLGLSNTMLNVRDFNDLIKTAQNGNLVNIDLNIEDITTDINENLPLDATASNFGKISDLASKSDLALGIINLVFQTIGVISVFATKIYNLNDIVLTGNLANVPQAKEIFKRVADMFHVKFYISENAEFATAVGAALMHNEKEKCFNIQ
ncbi:type II pantothenate kinase [Clostridium sp. 19966]|uniref:type II pantothenate kinase n=1 Tax=Clostridium sp. 19966 TaxID=2768166 RepID=UPI0028DD588F|nr:type II pantothenate kinase [Clostridium sp. 19966]MDT8716272.1 type II pantothenate kinase [Clostridium sp. 19966]